MGILEFARPTRGTIEFTTVSGRYKCSRLLGIPVTMASDTSLISQDNTRDHTGPEYPITRHEPGLTLSPLLTS